MITVLELTVLDNQQFESITMLLPFEDNLIREDVETIEELEVKWRKCIGRQNNFTFEKMQLRTVFETNEEKQEFTDNLTNLFKDYALVINHEIIRQTPVVSESYETVICECLDFYIFSSLADKTIVKSDPWADEWVIITAHQDISRYWIGDGNNPESDDFFECSVCNSIISSSNGYMYNYREKVYDNTPIWKTKDYEDEVYYSEDLHYTCTKCKEKEDGKSGMNESIINGYLRGYFAISSSLEYESHDNYYIKGKYPESSAHSKLMSDAKELDYRFLLMIEYESLSITGNEGYVKLLKKRKPIEKKPTMKAYGYHSQSGFDDMPSGWMIKGGVEAYYEDVIYYERQLLEKANEEVGNSNN